MTIRFGTKLQKNREVWVLKILQVQLI